MFIRLRAGDHVFSAELLEQEEFTSLSTGAALHRFKVSFDTPNLAQRDLIEKFDGSLFALDAKSEPVREFRAGARSSSYAQGSSRTTFTWELIEKERLTLKELKIGGLTITPSNYDETFGADGKMTITSHCRLQASEYAAFRSLPEQFGVVRVGINEQAREMRLGRIYWSKHDDVYKISLVLVDHSSDQPPLSRKASFADHFFHSYPAIARNAARMAALIDIMQRKGLLDKTEAEAVQAPSNDIILEQLYELDRVEDAEEW